MIAQSAISQEKYPQKWIRGNDTLVVISPVQLKAANAIFQERDFLKIENSSMRGVMNLQITSIEKSKSEIAALKTIDENQKIQIERLNALNEEQKRLYEENRKKFRQNGWIIGSVCVSVGLIAGLLLAR